MRPIDFSNFVEELAALSREVILPFFRSSLHVENKHIKGGFDPVTEADRAAEVVMRRRIREIFPTHGIIGEEFGEEQETAEYTWVLDPIDGTRSFMAGLPTWGTLIGLRHDRHPCYGLMSQPFTEELFWGDGEMSFWRGAAFSQTPTEKRIRTHTCKDISHAILATTHPFLIHEAYRPAFQHVEAQARLSIYGGDCYTYCLLAAGHVDLILETGLKIHDVSALIPIIKGAGGEITTWTGGDASSGGTILAAGDPVLHAHVLHLLAQKLPS